MTKCEVDSCGASSASWSLTAETPSEQSHLVALHQSLLLEGKSEMDAVILLLLNTLHIVITQ